MKLLALVILITFFLSVFAQTPRDILVEFYESTNGPFWTDNTNWNSSISYCSWKGILCDSNQEVFRVSLMSNNLVGTIPSTLFTIPSLQRVYLDSNQLTGVLNPTWFNATQLTRFSLMENKFTGTIPREVGQLSSLGLLDLSINSLSGTIPTEIINMKQLFYIDISVNQLTGSIPENIGELSSIYYFFAHTNQLSGTIPMSIGNASNLYSLMLYNNRLTGTIPSTIGQLSILGFLAFDTNQMSGSIPNEFYSLYNLQKVFLNTNSFSGTISPSIGNLTLLTELYLDTNYFSGTIPSELKSLTNLNTLRLRENQFSGIIPSELGLLSKLTHLMLDNNQLSGWLPSSIGQLSFLKELFLGYNNLEGTLPDSIYDLSRLTFLQTTRNSFQGTLSDRLCQMKSLEVLYLNKNMFSGAIPRCIGNLTSLTFLYLESLSMNETIPESICDLIRLEQLSFPKGLSGTIPSCLNRLTKLNTLALTDTSIEGTIPDIFWSMNKLKYLYIQSNRLSGSIPPSFQNLTNIQSIYLRNNLLNGTLEFSRLLLPSIEELDISNNRFTSVSDCRYQDPLIYYWDYRTQPISAVNTLNMKQSFERLDSLQTFRLFQCIRSYAANTSSIDLSYNQLTYQFDGTEFSGAYYEDHTRKYYFYKYNCFYNLVSLRMSHNNLTGLISTAFKSFEPKISIDVSYNNFYGPVSFTVQYLNVLENSLVRGSLDDIITTDPTQLLAVPTIGLVCPVLVYKSSTSLIVLPPVYTDYTHCYCNQYQVWNGSRCNDYTSTSMSCTRSTTLQSCIVHKGWYPAFLANRSKSMIKCLKPYHCNPSLKDQYLQQDNSQLSLIKQFDTSIQQLSDSSFQCAPGHSGMLCSECISGWYSSFGDCYQCSAGNLAGSICICIILFILFNGYVYKQTRNNLSSQETIASKGSISILIFYFQLLVLSKQIISQTSPNLQESTFSSVLSQIVYILSNFNPQGLECLIHYTYQQIHYVVIFLPLIIIGWASLLFIITRKWSKEENIQMHFIYAILLSFTLLFMNVSKAIFEVWNCDTTGDISFLSMKPYVSCLSQEYRDMYASSIFWFVVFVIGFPSLIGWLNYHQIAKMNSIVTRPSFWFYETFLLLRKVLITLVGMVLSNTTVKIISMIWILLSYLFIHLTLKPYQHWFNNALEAVALLHVILYLATSIVSNSSIYSFSNTSASGFITVLDISSIVIVASVVIFKLMSKRINTPEEVPVSKPETIELDHEISIRIHH